MNNREKNPASCCCRPDCCSSPATEAADKRRIVIDLLYLDVTVCTWCKGTEASLNEALSDVASILQAGGVEVVVNRIHVDSEEKAERLRFVSSPTIRVNGRDIQLNAKESRCESCGDLCGDDVDCRVWVFHGKEYTSPPKPMIIDAILREAYGSSNQTANPQDRFVVPDNLKKFFRLMKEKNQG